jgi:hypothetical protein
MLSIRKMVSGKGFEVVIPDGTCAWIGKSKGEALAIVQAVAPLLDWTVITARACFDSLPVETRRAIGIAGHEAQQAHREAVKAAKLDKQVEAAKMDAVYAAGVPWSDAPKGTPYKLDKRIPATWKGAPWITDGYMGVAGEHIGTDDRSPVKMDQIIPAMPGDRAEPVAYYQIGKNRYAVLSNGSTVNADFLAYFGKAFKGCEYRTAGKLMPVTVHHDGVIVGLFMPLDHSKGVALPAYIASVIASI